MESLVFLTYFVQRLSYIIYRLKHPPSPGKERVSILKIIHNGKMMLKSKSTADILTQTDNSYRQYGTLCTSIIEQKRKLYDHLANTLFFIIAILFYKNRLHLTEENKKQEPYRQYSTMSLTKYQNQYPKSGIFLKNQILPKNDTQNRGIAQRGTKKSGNTPKSTQNNGASPYHDICKLPRFPPTVWIGSMTFHPPTTSFQAPFTVTPSPSTTLPPPPPPHNMLIEHLQAKLGGASGLPLKASKMLKVDAGIIVW